MTQSHPLQRLKNIYHLVQSWWANTKNGWPANKLTVIAVTGTDGKTTTTSMIYHVLKESGVPVGYISTIEARIGDRVLDTGLHVTTPEPWEVPVYLKQMVNEGITHVVLESTSSGLQQNRLFGVDFDAALITNIKIDHLEYHGTWENYAKAKYMVATKLKKNGLLVLNKDDEKSADWLEKQLSTDDLKNKQSLEVSWTSKADIQNITESTDGTTFMLQQDEEYSMPVIGQYNQENALEAIEVCKRYVSPKQIGSALKTLPVPKGRMEIIQKEPVTVIIDFAHTGHALEEALKAVQKIRPEGAKIFSVFGCAGKRDRSRRSMGEVASRLGDVLVLTAEDPRDEKLSKVNQEIADYAKPNRGEVIARISDQAAYRKTDLSNLRSKIDSRLGKQNIPIITFDEDSVNSRRDAIDAAIKLAKPGDIVFITGKAHEQSLCFGETEYPWSDHEAVEAALGKQKE